MLRAFTLCLALLSPLVAAAGPPESEDADVMKARQRFRIGQGLFNQADYEGALREFEAARVMKAVPEFEYNIGICLEHLGRQRDAIDAYKRYIDGTLDANAIAEAKQRVERLEAELLRPKEESARAPAPAPQVIVQPAAPTPSYTAPAAVGVLALALAGVAVALIAPVFHDYDLVSAAWDKMPTYELAAQADYLKTRLEAGWALLGVAGVAAVIDVVLWVRAGRSGGDKPRHALVPALATPRAALTF